MRRVPLEQKIRQATMFAGLEGGGDGLTANATTYDPQFDDATAIPVIELAPPGTGPLDTKNTRWYTLDAVEQWACELLVMARQLKEEGER